MTTEPEPSDPARATQLIGHVDATNEFAAAFATGRPHHAWLLQGPRGIGKATAAFGMARRLLSNDRASGIEAASVARLVEEGAHPNLQHVEKQLSDRGTLKTQITVDEIRKLKRFFQTTSGAGGWRIAIIDPIDDLNRNAANALLKVLEEPPERCMFLLVNHSPGRLLPTIRSRCRILRFSPLTSSEVLKTLTLLEAPGSGKDLEAAASLANGSVQEAMMLLDGGGLELEQKLDRLLGTTEPEWQEIAALADSVTQRGGDTAFDLVVTSLGRRIAEDSERAVRDGRLGLAAELAGLGMEEGARFREALAFNLDRKQVLLTHFARRHRAKAMSGPH